MLKFVTALSAALIIGWALVGSATTASARHHRHGCCGPLPPSYTYKTKNVYKHITRHHDVWRTRYFKRIKPIVHVTRIRPIVHVHMGRFGDFHRREAPPPARLRGDGRRKRSRPRRQ